MKRKDFLKRLGIGLGVAIVAPKVLAEMPGKEETIAEYKDICLGDIFLFKKLSHTERGNKYIVSAIYGEEVEFILINQYRVNDVIRVIVRRQFLYDHEEYERIGSAAV